MKSSFYDEEDSQFTEESIVEGIAEALGHRYAVSLYQVALAQAAGQWADSPVFRAVEAALRRVPDQARAPLSQAAQVARYVAQEWGAAHIDRNMQDACMMIALHAIPRPLTRDVGAICEALYEISLNRQEAGARFLFAILAEEDAAPLRKAIRDGVAHDPPLDGDLRR